MQFFLALIMCTVIGAVAGYIGSLMVTKRMALMGGALGHLTLPGISLALIYNFDVSIGAILFLGFGILLIWLIERKTQLPTESVTATVFATSLAIAFLFLPKNKTSIALIGDISQITFMQAAITVLLSIAIFIVIKKIYYKMILISISKDLAHVKNIKTATYNFVYLICIALIVALGVRIVGGLMTAALVAIPACTSKNVSKNLFQYSYGSLIFGALSGIFGILISKFTHIPVGPLIIISSSAMFLFSLFFTNNLQKEQIN